MAFEPLSNETYISLTTFRRDGRAVATPVQFAIDGERVVVSTRARSGKMKRIRHTPLGKVAACNMRGQIRSGAVLDVHIRVLEPSEYQAARSAMLRGSRPFFRFMWRVSEGFQKIRGQSKDSVWLELRPST